MKGIYRVFIFIIVLILAYLTFSTWLVLIPYSIGWIGSALIDIRLHKNKNVIYSNTNFKDPDDEEREEISQKSEEIELVPGFIEYDRTEFRNRIKQITETGGKNID
jgi:hypothetical protein